MNKHELTRRQFLKSASAATLATLGAGSPRAYAAAEKVEPLADSMILLWMGGAMCQTETFDPKRYTPFTPGIKPKDLLSTFPSIDTVVDNIKFSQGMENLAKVIDRGTVVRTYVGRDYGALAENLQHIPYQVKWHTGYAPPQTVNPPYLGAWLSHAPGPLNPDLPAYIDVSRPEDTGNVFLALASFPSSGFLGSEHGPLVIPDASRARDVIRAKLPEGRFENRFKKFRELVDASPASDLTSSHQRESMIKAMENAYRLVHSPSVKAFDMSEEPKEVYAKYDTGPFGRGCLLARRLVEARARFVEVHVDFENAKGWDTHGDGHNGVKKMKEAVDGPVAQLILDLEQRGLLKRTLVVLATEFGRATFGRGSSKVATIEKMEHYGIHGHFGGACSLLMFGGGVKQGFVYGKTSDEFPCDTVENPVHIHDLHATIYRIMGLSPKYNVEVEKRPFYITRDGIGKPIQALLG
ncbi:MAG: DUF1501 domain-containing protein [Actinomycetota bacterium]